MKSKQTGFTIVELTIVLGALAIGVACFGGVVYVLSHFIAKFW